MSSRLCPVLGKLVHCSGRCVSVDPQFKICSIRESALDIALNT